MEFFGWPYLIFWMKSLFISLSQINAMTGDANAMTGDACRHNVAVYLEGDSLTSE